MFPKLHTESPAKKLSETYIEQTQRIARERLERIDTDGRKGRFDTIMQATADRLEQRFLGEAKNSLCTPFCLKASEYVSLVFLLLVEAVDTSSMGTVYEAMCLLHDLGVMFAEKEDAAKVKTQMSPAFAKFLKAVLG